MLRAEERGANAAHDLKALRDKILDRLPEQFRQHRAAYPDYHGYAEAVKVNRRTV